MSENLTQLFSSGEIFKAIWETIYMTGISTFIAYIIGIPMGILLFITKENGLSPCKWLNIGLGFIVNLIRSVPFLILMVAIFPLSRFIAGTSLGNGAMIVTLIIGASPYVARMVESAICETDGGVIEAAQSMGATNFQIITRVILPEAKPSLITGSIISAVTIVGYSAMASTIGGGGLGAIAINYGYSTSDNDVIWVCVALTVLLVQILQIAGNLIVKKIDKRIKNK